MIFDKEKDKIVLTNTDIRLDTGNWYVVGIKSKSKARYMPKIGNKIRFVGEVLRTSNSTGNNVYRLSMYIDDELITSLTMNELNNLIENLIEIQDEPEKVEGEEF